MPGPPPNPNRRRRNVGPPIIRLPSEGRADAGPPKWPLGKPSIGESAVWLDLWRTPQAVMWERLAWARLVARYVRVLLRAEERDAGRDVMAEARQLEDRLGLTPMAMMRLHWEVASDELAEARRERAPSGPSGSAARLRAVDVSSAG